MEKFFFYRKRTDAPSSLPNFTTQANPRLSRSTKSTLARSRMSSTPGIPEPAVDVQPDVAPAPPSADNPRAEAPASGDNENATQQYPPAVDVQSGAAPPPPHFASENVPAATAYNENAGTPVAAAVTSQIGVAPPAVGNAPPLVFVSDADRAQNQANVNHIVDLTADEENEPLVNVPPIDWTRLDSHTPAPVLSSTPANIAYKPVKMALQGADTTVGDKNLRCVHVLEREAVQTFLRTAGCVVLQGFEKKSASALGELINSFPFKRITHASALGELINPFPFKRITQESEDVQLTFRHLADGLSEKDCSVNPITGNLLTLEQLSLTHFKPDVFRWKICQNRLGLNLASRLFQCFTFKYNLCILPKDFRTNSSGLYGEGHRN